MQRTHFVEAAAKQLERERRLYDPLVKQQDAEIEVVDPFLQRIEIDIRRLPLLGSFRFGDLFVGRIGILMPIGLFFYFRIWAFRIRLNKDMERIIALNRDVELTIKDINNKN